jgi:hypothetical protein
MFHDVPFIYLSVGLIARLHVNKLPSKTPSIKTANRKLRPEPKTNLAMNNEATKPRAKVVSKQADAPRIR